MQRLSALGKPYKYVVTCIIMQKTGGPDSRHSMRPLRARPDSSSAVAVGISDVSKQR
jgi:hypothetical protein